MNSSSLVMSTAANELQRIVDGATSSLQALDAWTRRYEDLALLGPDGDECSIIVSPVCYFLTLVTSKLILSTAENVRVCGVAVDIQVAHRT